MLLLVRPLLIMSAALLLLVACTRERPTPEPTATTAVQESAPATAAVAAQIVTTTQPSGASAEAGLVATNTPASLTPTPNGTPTAGTPETFPYVVREGDTLGSIAAQFETDIETLRRLNNLQSDNIAVGQPLNVPFVEGMTAEGVPTPTPGPFPYTIQPGDTLSGIAARFDVDPIAIQEANADTLLDPDNLVVGTTIIIPNYQPPATDAEGETPAEEESAAEGQGVIHTVLAGQGLLEISAIYGVSVEEIMAANGLAPEDILRVGQQLIIPGVTPQDAAAAQGNIHTVQPGDSLLSIALTYGVTVEALQEANNLDNPDAIFIGQQLIIPVE